MVVERKQCTFLSHDPPVLLAQLEEEYPGIYPLIPFYLGWKSGIMKELTELIFFCSEKGMGPWRIIIMLPGPISVYFWS
jgi:hypothetical protein